MTEGMSELVGEGVRERMIMFHLSTYLTIYLCYSHSIIKEANMSYKHLYYALLCFAVLYDESSKLISKRTRKKKKRKVMMSRMYMMDES